MMCPIMTKDPVTAPMPCVENCAWKVQGLCAVNVVAQALYHREKRGEQKAKEREHSSTETF